MKKLFLIFSSFGEALSLLKKDKTIKFLSLIPFGISIILYGFLGKLLFVDLKDYGVSKLEDHFSMGHGLGTIITSVLVLFLTLVLLLIVNWTFVLLVSLFASPFNDTISARCEAIILNSKIKDEKTAFLKKLIKIVVNEGKKIVLIFLLMVLAFTISFIPILAPLGLFISSLLVAIQFLDYNWSRHQLTYSECLMDLRKNLLSYFISGAIFLAFFSLPYINIIFLPLGVIYFSVLWQRYQELER